MAANLSEADGLSHAESDWLFSAPTWKPPSRTAIIPSISGEDPSMLNLAVLEQIETAERIQSVDDGRDREPVPTRRERHGPSCDRLHLPPHPWGGWGRGLGLTRLAPDRQRPRPLLLLLGKKTPSTRLRREGLNEGG